MRSLAHFLAGPGLVSGLMLAAALPAAAGTSTVASIAPASGSVIGATPVTVTGTGFQRGATLKIGNVVCTALKVISPTTIIAVTGAHAAGPVSVKVFNSAIDSSGVNTLYTYDQTTDLTKTTKAQWEAAGSTFTRMTTTGLDSTLRWSDWSAAAGGAMVPGSYYYVVTAVNAAGETRRSIQSTGTLLAGANTAVQLCWTPIAGALQYKLYRTSVPGVYGANSFIATLDTTCYKDVALVATAGTPPGVNGATGDAFLARAGAPAAAFTNGPLISGAVGSDAFTVARTNGTFLTVLAGNANGTSIYNPVTNTFAPGPNTTAPAGRGACGFKRPDGKFVFVLAGTSTATSIYDPVANTMVAGPVTSSNVDLGGCVLKRPDGKFLVVCGNNGRTTSIYDPGTNTFAAGPLTTGNCDDGACALSRPDGKFLIVHAGGSTGSSIYDPVANTFVAGPALTGNASRGAHGIQRPDGRWLIPIGNNASTTSLYDPVANTMVAGPVSPSGIRGGAHSIQRGDGTFLIVCGRSNAVTVIYDPVANTIVAGPNLPNTANSGAHSFQLTDGRYMVLNGSGGTNTALYDAGWNRTGSYVSEALHPVDINFWNTFSWVRDTDDTVATKLRTAISAGALAAAAWRNVANGGAIAPGVGETYLQVGADVARAIPVSSGALQDVWAPWAAEFRRFAGPDLMSVTANYTPTSLSVSPSKASFTFGGQPFNTWVAPDSSTLLNDGTSASTLHGTLSTFTSGALSWALSPIVNGVDQVRAQWSSVSVVGPWNDIAGYNTDFTIATGVATGGSVRFYFRILTPTLTVTGIPYASTITVTAQ